MTEREGEFEVRIMGVKLGTAMSWDNGGDEAIQFENFIPCEELKEKLGEGILQFDYGDKGGAELWPNWFENDDTDTKEDDEGNPIPDKKWTVKEFLELLLSVAEG